MGEDEQSIVELYGNKSAYDVTEYGRSKLRSLFGEYSDVIYQLISPKGDTSYVHKSIEGLPKEERFEGQINELIRLLQGGEMPDTLKGGRAEADKIISPMSKGDAMKGNIQTLLQYLGITK